MASRDRLRLLFLVNSLAPYGAETFVLNHARHSNRDRFDVTVCHPRGRDLRLVPQCVATCVAMLIAEASGITSSARMARVAQRWRFDVQRGSR